MAAKTTIGEHTYLVSFLDARHGLRLGMRLAALAAPAVMSGDEARARGALADLLTSGKLATELDAMIEALADVTQVFSGDKSRTLSDVLSQHFAGRHAEMFEWLYFAARVNFESFFAGLPGLAVRVAADMGMADNSTSPQPAAKSG
jgi:hypothetical protein